MFEVLASGEARLVKDEIGQVQVVYKDTRNVPLLSYVDKSRSNVIHVAKTEKDHQNQVTVCLQLIEFIKTNRAPKGVDFGQTKTKLSSTGKYREGHEFTKQLNDILGKGATAGDIVVVKDNKTGTKHAQKTVMISDFRTEEVRAWVDIGELTMDGEALCPALYCFYLQDNEIFFHMEKLDRAITLRDVIDSHMKTIREKEPSLVRPFSLYICHGLLSAVSLIHGKNWTHRDLHGGNVMVQETDHKLSLKVLDFGKANPLRGESYDLRGEQDDIYQIIRLFSAIYVGDEFESVKHMKDSYGQSELIGTLSADDKTEMIQLIDALLSVAENEKNMDDVRKDLETKMKSTVTDGMLKKVATLLFPDDNKSKHDDDLRVKIGILSADDKTEMIQLIDTLLSVADIRKDLETKMKSTVTDGMLKKVAALLFPDDDNKSKHDDDLRVKIGTLSADDKTEMIQLIDALLSVVENEKNKGDVRKDLETKMKSTVTDGMLKKVAALLFPDDDNKSKHDDDLRVKIGTLSADDKTEMIQLIDALLSVVENEKNKGDVRKDLETKMKSTVTDGMLKKVATLLFPDDNKSKHDDDLRVKGAVEERTTIIAQEESDDLPTANNSPGAVEERTTIIAQEESDDLPTANNSPGAVEERTTIIAQEESDDLSTANNSPGAVEERTTIIAQEESDDLSTANNSPGAVEERTTIIAQEESDDLSTANNSPGAVEERTTIIAQEESDDLSTANNSPGAVEERTTIIAQEESDDLSTANNSPGAVEERTTIIAQEESDDLSTANNSPGAVEERTTIIAQEESDDLSTANNSPGAVEERTTIIAQEESDDLSTANNSPESDDDDKLPDPQLTDPQLTSTKDSLTPSEIIKVWRSEVVMEGTQPVLIQRKRVLQTARRAVLSSDFDFWRRVYVTFFNEGVGLEDGADDGGLRREFFTELMKELKANILEGSSFRHDVGALEAGRYREAGKMVAWSVLNGGPGFPFFSRSAYAFLVGREVGDIRRDDVPDLYVHDKLHKILACDTTDALRIVCQNKEMTAWILDSGVTKPICHLEVDDKEDLVRQLFKSHMFYRVHAEIQQFCLGLQDMAFLQYVTGSPETTESMFVDNDGPVTYRQLKSMYSADLSPSGSNNRSKEDDTLFAFEDYLRDCENEDSTVTVPDVLRFWTGSERVPPIGFDNKLSITFVPDRRPAPLPVARTCGLVLELMRGFEADKFAEKMTYAINHSGGFFII
ncbi:uncharacterized protein [Haliotis cracherodii]